MGFVDRYTLVCMYIKLLKLTNLHQLHPMNSNSVLNLPFYVQAIKGFDIQIYSDKHSGYFYFGFKKK